MPESSSGMPLPPNRRPLASSAPTTATHTDEHDTTAIGLAGSVLVADGGMAFH